MINHRFASLFGGRCDNTTKGVLEDLYLHRERVLVVNWEISAFLIISEGM